MSAELPLRGLGIILQLLAICRPWNVRRMPPSLRAEGRAPACRSFPKVAITLGVKLSQPYLTTRQLRRLGCAYPPSVPHLLVPPIQATVFLGYYQSVISWAAIARYPSMQDTTGIIRT